MNELLFHFQEAFHSLRSSRLRSFLAVLGILVGTASIVAMLACGQIATQTALKQFKTLGTDLLAVNVYPNKQGALDNFTVQEIKKIQTLHPDIDVVAPYTSQFASPIIGGRPSSGAIIGATKDLAHVIKITLNQGRFVNPLDKNRYFAVIGESIARKMGSDNPIGQQLQLGKVYYTVVGVAHPWPENNFFFQNINESIIVPISTAKATDRNTEINNLVMTLKPNAPLNEIQESISDWITKHFPDVSYRFVSPKSMIETMEKQNRIFTLLLGIIGSISLLVGGIGVMNIMLVSVIERRREIGIRKAIGAHPRDILRLFIVEALVLSIVGGIGGLMLGLGVSFAISTFKGWDFAVYWLPLITGFLLTLIIGILSGTYPAKKAANLDPIQTLRL